MYLREKLAELKKYLAEYEKAKPTWYAYRSDVIQKAAGERYFEKIVECATDVAILVAKAHKLERPEDDVAVFEALAKHKLLTSRTAESMRKAKSMRNFIVHQYGKVKDDEVYNSLTKELPRDIKKFIEEIEESSEKS